MRNPDADSAVLDDIGQAYVLSEKSLELAEKPHIWRGFSYAGKLPHKAAMKMNGGSVLAGKFR